MPTILPNRRRSVLKSALLGVSVAAVSATGAIAQDSQRATDIVRDQIFVTGTKKAGGEELQSAPVAVTAYGAEALDALFVRDVTSLSYSIPNVQLEDVGTFPGTANFSIRGIAVNSSIPSIDPAVALVYDGVPLAINNGVIFDTFDLEAVEVLRGPQGTLFGRNATAGAVVLRTSDPTDELTIKAKAAVETGLLYRTSGVISGPVIEDVLSAKLGILYEDDKGYFENAGAALNNPVFGSDQVRGALRRDDLGARETFVIRPAIRFTPTDFLEIVTKYERGEVDGFVNPGQNRAFNGDEFEVSINEFGSFEADWTQVTNEINWDVSFGNGTITNITGYRDYTSVSIGDVDSLPAPIFSSFARTEHEQFSNELRYSGRFGDRVEVTAGLFYLDQDLLYIEDRDIPSQRIPLNPLDPGSPLVPIPFIGGGEQDVETFGIFAQADVELTDQFTLILGGRYSDESKTANIERIFSDNDCTRDGCSSFDVNGLEAGFSAFTPKVGVQYEPTDNFQAYVSYTESIRSGGFNFRNTTATTPIEPFDEEEVQSIEAGIKTELFDNRLRLNAAIFQMKLDDLQREVNRSDNTSQVVQEITNTADATIEGIEAEFLASVTDNFVVTGQFGITTGDYDEVRFDISGDGIVSDNDLRLDLPRLAPRTYGIGFIYDQDFGSGGIVTARANYNHRASAKYTDNNLGIFPEADMIDASLAWNPPAEGWTVSAYGKNLLNEITFGNDTQLPFGTFSPLNKGRIVGVEVKFEY
ncbi:MAG: TonB-dependent receptor [Pseudomonadota bacterium]